MPLKVLQPQGALGPSLSIEHPPSATQEEEKCSPRQQQSVTVTQQQQPVVAAPPGGPPAQTGTTTAPQHHYPRREGTSPRPAAPAAMQSAPPKGAKQPLRTSDRTSKRRKLGANAPAPNGQVANGVLAPVQQTGGAANGTGQRTCPKCGAVAMVAGIRCRRCSVSAPQPIITSSTPRGGNGGPKRQIKAHRKSGFQKGLGGGQLSVYTRNLGMAPVGAGLEYESPHVSPASALAPIDLERHVEALRTEGILRAMRPILSKLMIHPVNKGTFNVKVDAVALNIPTYYNVVKVPMDFGTIKGRLQSLYYKDMVDFAADVRQVFANARLFNPKGHWAHEAANSLEAEFEADFDKVVTKAEKTVKKASEHRCSLCKGQECELCGEKCIRLEPPVLMCQGQCGQRIKRGGVYYISKDGSRIFCQRCHSGLPPALIPTHPEDETDEEDEDDDERMVLDGLEDEQTEQMTGGKQAMEEEEEVAAPVPIAIDRRASDTDLTAGMNGGVTVGPLMKKDLLKRKFDDEIVEPWVRCNGCDKWLHQICALYNPSHPHRGREWPGGSPGPNGASKAQSSTTPRFYCPACKLRSYSYRASMLAGASSGSGGPSKLMIHPALTSLHAPGSSYHAPPPTSQPLPALVPPVPLAPPPPPSVHYLPPGMARATPPLVVTPVMSPSAASVASASTASHSGDSTTSARSEGGPARGLWCADALPETNMSRFIQTMVQNLLQSLGEHEASQSVSVRVVSSIERTFDVHKTVRSCFALGAEDLNRSMSYKSKGILLFQKIDGLDICLFSMYVQEYDASAAAPNSRRVYIAYLDSVEYFRPRTARTKVYHEILVSYLLWSQLRGFRAAHIWACPPQRGNNFIFWCHPQHQKTPSKDRLLEWYRAMLQRAKELGALHKVSNLYDAYFKDISATLASQPTPPSAPASAAVLARAVSDSNFSRLHSPPLFEGDFWVEETLRLHFILRRRASMDAQYSSGSGPQTPGHLCGMMLKALLAHSSSLPFKEAVDPVLHKAPRYFEIVKRPMDLGTVGRKLRDREYASLLELKEDVELVFENAMTYNPPLHFVHRMAVELRTVFYREFGRVVSKCLGKHTDDVKPSASLKSTGSSSSSSSSSSMQPPPPVKVEPGASTQPSTTGAGLMDSLAQLDHPTWDNALLHRISLAESLAFIAATLGQQANPGEQPDPDGPSTPLDPPVATATDPPQPPAPSGSLDQQPTQLPSSLPLPPEPLLPHSVSTMSCCTSVSGRGTFISPRQIVTELVRSVDKMKEDLLVLHLQPLDEEPPAPAPAQAAPAQASQSVQADSSADAGSSSAEAGTPAEAGSSAEGTAPMAVEAQGPEDASLAMAKELMAATRAAVPFGDTTDPDHAVWNSLVDSRHTFLEMCQFRHYQFDTLRRAKYSSAMVLYHLLDSASPALRVLCTSCMKTIPAGSLRWHCGTCSSVDLCNSCFEENTAHEHPMTPYRVTFSSPNVDQSSSQCP